MIWPVLALVAVGLLIAAPMTLAVRAIGRRAGVLDSAGSEGHEKELRSVPNIGGVAIFAGVIGPLLVGTLGLMLLPMETWTSVVPALADHVDRLESSRATVIALMACVTVLHIMGLVDDRRGLGPYIKLGVQVLLAMVMVVGFEVRLLELLDGYVPGASIVVTILWIVAITNAINFLDNMDGLAAGVSIIAGSLLMATTLINHQWFIAATLALLVGSLLGFLLFNFPPASIFMGDGGSLIVGFLLAVLTARTTFFHDTLGGGWYGVFMPVIILAIPLYDFCSVTFIRVRQGRNPFVGDQQHFSHRLVQRGLSKRGAVVMIWCFAAITGIGGVFIGTLELWQALLVVGQTLLVLLSLLLLEHASRRSGSRDDGE